jgi:polygalacturonase
MGPEAGSAQLDASSGEAGGAVPDGGAAPLPPAAMFSNPAAVRVPTFPDRSCPVVAGANTAAINAAIASCSGMGGGVVTFAPGTYTVGSIRLKSNVKLLLGGATLRNGGGIDPAEPYTVPIRCQDEGHSAWHNAMFWGENLTNVAIVGPGTLDGTGLDGEFQKMIAIKSSTGLLFDNLTQRNTGHFGYLLTDCHHITLSRLTIRPTRDGVNLMQCTNVNAHDLNITGGPDDAFALKSDCSLGRAMRTENITIRDSSFSASIANAAQIGSETWGDFENISWSNIRILGGAKAGIGIQMNDGAIIKNLSYDNVTITNTSYPIFISTTGLLRASTKTPGHAENIRFRNITASNIVAGNNPSAQNSVILISGAPGIVHKGIVLENVKVTFPGGGRPSDDPPEGTALRGDLAYNPRFITPMPAYGVFARHVNGLELRDVKLSFGGAEQRPAVIARDVDGLLFEKLGAQKGTGPMLELDGVKNLRIRDSAPLPDTTSPTVDKTTF